MDGWSAGRSSSKNKDSPPADDVLHHHLGAVLVWCKRKLTTKQMTQSTYHVWGWNSLARRQWFVVLNRRPIEVAVRHQLSSLSTYREDCPKRMTWDFSIASVMMMVRVFSSSLVLCWSNWLQTRGSHRHDIGFEGTPLAENFLLLVSSLEMRGDPSLLTPIPNSQQELMTHAVSSDETQKQQLHEQQVMNDPCCQVILK